MGRCSRRQRPATLERCVTAHKIDDRCGQVGDEESTPVRIVAYGVGDFDLDAVDGGAVLPDGEAAADCASFGHAVIGGRHTVAEDGTLAVGAGGMARRHELAVQPVLHEKIATVEAGRAGRRRWPCRGRCRPDRWR